MAKFIEVMAFSKDGIPTPTWLAVDKIVAVQMAGTKQCYVAVEAEFDGFVIQHSAQQIMKLIFPEG